MGMLCQITNLLYCEFDEWLFGCGDDEESEADGGGKGEREKAPEPKYVPKNTTPEVAVS